MRYHDIMLRLPVYMDNHATTRTDPRVVEAMVPFFTEQYGNAASRQHSFGRDAEEAANQARRQVADSIGASPERSSLPAGRRKAIILRSGRGGHVSAAGESHHYGGHGASGRARSVPRAGA